MPTGRSRFLRAYAAVVDRVGGVRTNLRRVFGPWLRARERDAAARAWPPAREVVTRLPASRRALRAEHRRYTKEVSDWRFALSLPASALLDALCRVTAPRRILDLGSGFSSWVVRRYRAESGDVPFVRSVDDDPGWLAKTRAFLDARGLPPGELGGLETLDRREAGTFDLVCFDLGTMERRASELPRALSFARPGSGVVLLDDLHIAEYRSVVEAELARRDVVPIPLRLATMDRMGRFSWIVTGL